MVFVRMGEQHGIQLFYVGAQHLVPEVGRGIYDNGCGGSDCTRMLVRRRLSFLSADVHTAQGQPIMGMPVLVPVPRKVIFSGGCCTKQM
jgi:hypothetical protein